MKKALFFPFVASVLLACNDTAPPKEIATEFVQAVQSGDAAKAASLSTEKTKAFAGAAKLKAASSGQATPLTGLTETITGTTATVKNEAVIIDLEKEGSEWKVSATPELLATLTENPQHLDQLKLKWQALLKEFQGRVNVAKEYVQYKKGQGSLSAPMQNLEAMVNKLSIETAWSKEAIRRYAQEQKDLVGLLDKAHEPTLTANADLSMNYFLQLSQADDRIRSAQKEYNDAVMKMPSVMYPLLPVQ